MSSGDALNDDYFELLDMYNKTLFLRIFAVIFGAVGAPVALLTGGFTLQLLWVMIGSLVLTLPIFVFITVSGDTLGDLLLGLGKRDGVKERVASDILKARYALSAGKMSEAKEFVAVVLKEIPDCGDALLIRAQASLRGGEVDQARADLEHILRICDKEEVCRRWALGFLRELNENEGVVIKNPRHL